MRRKSNRRAAWLVGVAGFATLFSIGVASAQTGTGVSPVRGIERAQLPQPTAIRGGTEYRSLDGSGNNLANSDVGAAGISLQRWSPSDYADAVSAMAGAAAPNPRDISNAVADQPLNLANRAAASDFLWLWGQFLDHDIDLTDGMDPPEPADIAIPPGDLFFDPMHSGTVTLSFNRSLHDPASGTGPANPREQMNEITAWIDGSNVYGSDATRAAALRALDGTGRLQTSAGDLLPFNLDGLPNAGGSGPELFLAGDVRANEHVGLTAMHTLFVREHNRQAANIAFVHPEFSGEQIYQEARRLVIAQLQAITYREFLPVLLGPDALPAYAGYRPEVDAGVANIFSTAAYRLGHSMLSPTLLRVDAQGAELGAGHLALRDAFFAPQRLVAEGGIDPLLRGMARQVCQVIDVHVVDDVRNFLFGPPGAGGFDLVSLNIQRGRDHGLPRYNMARVAFGLAPAVDFAAISSNPATQARLASVYANADAVDLWVGILAEDHQPGALVGELAGKILKKQFANLRDGDRFWYELDLTPIEIQKINDTTLADVIKHNTAIGGELPADVFRVADLADADGDSVEDIWDNCTQLANPAQRDTDADGYGNACDTDLTNDGQIDFRDLGEFKLRFFSTDADADFNGDGSVDFEDLALMRAQFFAAPGPSAHEF